MRGSFIPVLFSLLVYPRSCPAQVPQDATAQVVVAVVDARTGAPLPGVTVRDRTSHLEAPTDSEGKLVVRASAGGTLTLDFPKAGYRGSVRVLSVAGPPVVRVQLTSLVTESLRGWPVVEGRVTDAVSGAPLEGVWVRDYALALSAISGPRGDFTFGTLRPGPLRFVFSRMGYADREVTLDVEEGRRVELRVEMAGEPIELEPIEVRVERWMPVERRDPRALGASTRIEDFGAANDVVEMLRWHKPGVQVEEEGGELKVLIRGMSSLVSQGPPLLILDGIILIDLKRR